MLAFLDYEEKVGWLWHRWIGDQTSHPDHPDAAVSFEQMAGSLPIFFRAIGGDPGLELAAGTARHSEHRLRLWQRLGMERERLNQAERNGARVLLPARLALLPDAELNRALYRWLAAFLALAEAPTAPPPVDPLQADLACLNHARQTTALVLATLPGLASCYRQLAATIAALRPKRRLPPIETAVEQRVLAVLAGAEPAQGSHATLPDTPPDLARMAAPRGYRPFLPVPLWGEIAASAALAPAPDRADQTAAPGQATAPARDPMRRARRQDPAQQERRDPLTLINKGELLQLATEMVGVNRPSDEDSAEGARRALADMDELTLGHSRQSVGAGLQLALDLAPSATTAEPLAGPLALPEWDHRQQRYLAAHCLVQAAAASMEGPHWRPDAAASRRIRQVRRRFEALRPRREIKPRQLDGSDLDMDALVRAAADRRASGRLSDRIYLATRDQARDLAVALLVDASLSTDAWVDDCRVLDVAKEAVTALALGLEACGDQLAIWSFTSNRRHAVRLARLKSFDEPLASPALARIAALEPGYYTRMGAALRYARLQLEPRPERHRLILLLSDGKPHDIDHYDGRHGIEDTRMAVREARRSGVAVFAIAIDRNASAHLPYLFGRGGYALVSRIGRLVPALPQIYRQLVG